MLPDVGYVVGIDPHLASYRLRVAGPAPHLGIDYRIGSYGKASFFYKHDAASRELADEAERLGLRIVYDVVNDHFGGKWGDHYRQMCDMATRITCASEWMARRIAEVTGYESTVIPDPWENEEQPVECFGRDVLWFGHSANLSSALEAMPEVVLAQANPVICSNVAHDQVVLWSRDEMRRQLDNCALVLLTGNNPGASANRVLAALRGGRFVVAQYVEAWSEFEDFIWIGDVREGIEWALNNRQEACAKVTAGQEYIRDRFSPQSIGRQWGEMFRSLSG